MAAGVFTPYSTVAPFIAAMPAWVPELEKERVASYQIYEEIYWNVPTTFKLVARGTENKPIYLPSGRVIVETINRYIGKDFWFRVDPAIGEDAAQEAAKAAFTALFRRERVHSKFNANKRFGVIRGDWVFHVTADPTKPPGTRLSVNTVDPGAYFPIYSGDNLDHIEKVILAEEFIDDDDKTRIKKQTYERDDSGIIWSSSEVYDMNNYAQGKGPDRVISSPSPLPAEITAFPVYHIRNFDEPGNPYGSSEMRGLETIMAAMNQSVSDEDLALAMEGLGVYTTDGGGPVDEDGNPTDWILGPGRVIENGSNFKRINGVGSVQPFQDHIGTLFAMMKQASGTPEEAIGGIDVQAAESGIALALRMSPILSRADEKEGIIVDVLTQMLFDMKAWLKAYEQIDLSTVDVLPSFGDKLPTNRKGEVDLVVKMVMADPPIMSAATARDYLANKGIEFSKDEFTRIIQERQAMSEAAGPVDEQGDRMAGDAANDLPDEASASV